MRLFDGEMLSMWNPARRISYDISKRRRRTRKTMRSEIENLLVRAKAQTAERSSVTSAARLFQTVAEAEGFFIKLKDKLFDIERWNTESEITRFSLYDADGTERAEKRAAVGDYIKLVMPASGKDDWVKIVEISDAPDEIVLTVRPSRNPTDEAGKSAVSHFFVAGSTNNFCLQRKNAGVNFCVIGLNEPTNTEQTSGIIETVRNLAMVKIGCFLGVQKAQWQAFCDNFIENGRDKRKQ